MDAMRLVLHIVGCGHRAFIEGQTEQTVQLEEDKEPKYEAVVGSRSVSDSARVGASGRPVECWELPLEDCSGLAVQGELKES
jgi:hypothetical protein